MHRLRSGQHPTFVYGRRRRWAFLPTSAFFLVLLLVLALDPTLLWSEGIDAETQRAAVLLCGMLAVGFAVALLARWTEPFCVTLEPDAFVARPLLGSPVRVPYDRIARVVERPPNFIRGHVELELRTIDRRRPLYIHGDIGDFPRLARLLRSRVPAAVRAEWKANRSA